MISYTLHINLFDLLSLTTVLVGSTFILQLWFKSSVNRSANRLLALALAVMVVWMTGKLLTDLGLAAPPCQFLLSFGPFLYFHVIKLVRPDSEFQRKDLLHFCPSVLELFFGIYGISFWIQPLAMASTGVYLYFSHRLIRDYYRQLKFTEGDRSLYEWRWLQNLLVSMDVVVMLSVPYLLLCHYFRFSGQPYYPLYIILAVTVIRMGAVVFFRSATIAPVAEPQLSRIPPSAALKQKGAWLKKTIAARLLYQDAELSVSSLAAQLDIPAYELSRIINTALKKNFSDFINEYRIADIIRKMQDPAYDRMTLEGIAFTSGFNSKTTFNRTFRQMTGKSPAEYKNLVKNQRPFSKTGVYIANRQLVLRHETALKRLNGKINSIAMIRNYIKIAFRNLIRDRAYSVLNLLGLSVGLASVIMIMAYVRYELSYDKSYSNHQQVYRLLMERKTTQFDELSVHSPVGISPVLQKEFPAVEGYVLFDATERQIKYKNDVISFKEIDGTDQFFKVFNFPFVKGNPATALKDPGSVVVTEKVAKQFFANENAIGNTLTDSKGTALHITGIIRDIPDNTHFKGDIVVSSSGDKHLTDPLNWNGYTALPQYVVLNKKADAVTVENNFKSIYKKYGFPKNVSVKLQPVTDIHLRSHASDEISVNSDIKYVYIFACVAILILFIACINYINLTTARSLQRAKEIGLRKVLGAMRGQLIAQFLTESFLFFLVSTALAIGLTFILWPVFSAKITFYQQVLPLFDARLLLIIFVILVAGGLLAGAYPAFFLSSLQPAKILKGLSKFGLNITLRKALVVLQFTISGVLIISTIIVYQQLNFVSNARLGFNKDHLLTLPYFIHSSPEPFRNELAKNPDIQSVAMASWEVGAYYGSWDNIRDKKDSTKETRIDYIAANPNFVKTLGMKIIDGRDFSTEHSNDVLSLRDLWDKHLPDDEYIRYRNIKSIILNQQAVKALNLKHPVGTVLTEGVHGTVVGVVEDFNGLSLHQKVTPVILTCSEDQNDVTRVFIRISPKNTQRAIAYIGNEWKKFYPNDRFDFRFADDQLQELYTADQRLGAIFGTFATLAIIIGCLGLFGLISLTVQNRVKEIGIRKVLGASVASITKLISVDFIKLVILSLIISSPVAWYMMNKWLQDFAYRVNIQWWVFALAGIVSILIAFFTVSFQAIKAAVTNPVKSLRSE